LPSTRSTGPEIGFCAPIQYPVRMHADDNLRRHYLDAMGIPVWERRALSVAPIADATVRKTAAPTAAVMPRPAETSPDWAALEEAVRSCTKCALHSTRTQTVFGVGNRKAQWMFVGEAPGADEDRQGEPFVGAAGKLLNAMLAALGLKREEVFIANVLKCLRYNAQVQLADGSWERIGRLVRSRYEGMVMSVDSEGRLVPRRVTGWHESPLGGRRVYRLTYRSAKKAGNGRVSIQLTGDHEVLTERGYVPVESLTQGDRIATGQGISVLARDVVIGTLLGDGTIDADSSHLSFSHSHRQRDYALFKAALLKELEPQYDEFAVAARSGEEKQHMTVQVRTVAHRALRIHRRDFYSPKKRVPAWIAATLNERMLAFWFMDDGYTRIRPGRQPLSEIATCCFTEADLHILAESLLRLGIRATIRRLRLHFDTASTKALSERIAPYVPPSMRYKLHPEVAARIPFDPEQFQAGSVAVLYDEVEIEDITDQPRTDATFFCIDVEETHNFVTAGGVVHNCRPPNNRDPQADEVEQCEPYLIRQIELIQPKLIVALGRHAAHSLLKTDLALARLRGQPLSYQNIPLVVTYHPAYLLRTPSDKRKAWEDLRRARSIIAETATP